MLQILYYRQVVSYPCNMISLLVTVRCEGMLLIVCLLLCRLVTVLGGVQSQKQVQSLLLLLHLLLYV